MLMSFHVEKATISFPPFFSDGGGNVTCAFQGCFVPSFPQKAQQLAFSKNTLLGDRNAVTSSQTLLCTSVFFKKNNNNKKKNHVFVL